MPCAKYFVNEVTSSACLFGCRAAALGTLHDESVRMYVSHCYMSKAQTYVVQSTIGGGKPGFKHCVLQECEVYCVGIQDQPLVLRYTGNLSSIERKFWKNVCEEGCTAGLS